MVLPIRWRWRWLYSCLDEKQAVPDGIGASGIVEDGLRVVVDGEVLFDDEAEGLCEERCEGDDPVDDVMSF